MQKVSEMFIPMPRYLVYPLFNIFKIRTIVLYRTKDSGRLMYEDQDDLSNGTDDIG